MREKDVEIPDREGLFTHFRQSTYHIIPHLIFHVESSAAMFYSVLEHAGKDNNYTLIGYSSSRVKLT